MAFSLENQLQLLDLGENFKVKVDWYDYRQDDKGYQLFGTLLSKTSSQTHKTWLKLEDLRHLGYDFTKPYDSASSWIPIKGEMVLKPGSTLSQNAIKILWDQLRQGETEHANDATKNGVPTPKGNRYQVIANSFVQFREFVNLGYGLHSQHPSHHPFAQGTSAEVNREAASSPGAGKQLGQQDPNNILSQSGLEEKSSLPISEQALIHSFQRLCLSDSNTNRKNATTKPRVPLKDVSRQNITTSSRLPVRDATNQEKKNSNGFNLAEYKKNILAIHRVDSPFLKYKFICKICGCVEDCPSKMKHHYLVHKRRGNGKHFCGICQKNYTSLWHHWMKLHQIYIRK